MPSVSTTAAPRPRLMLFRACCVVFYVLLLLGVVEGYFRFLRRPIYWTVADLRSESKEKKLQYTFDANIGYRPELGGAAYDEFGIRRDSYASATQPTSGRMLCLGDSVVARGRLIAALGQACPVKDLEILNAGVEGYEPSQELGYFESFSHQVHPDSVVLVFHNNDFARQPVVDFNDAGRVVFYGPGERWELRLPWLMRQSECVRWILASYYRKRHSTDRVEGALRRLADRLASQRVQFSVVLFPILKSYGQWSQAEKHSRNQAIKILERLGIAYFDLLPALERAVAAGVDPCDSSRDTWHPSDAVCEYLARQLREEQLFDGVAGAVKSASVAELPTRRPASVTK